MKHLGLERQHATTRLYCVCFTVTSNTMVTIIIISYEFHEYERCLFNIHRKIADDDDDDDDEDRESNLEVKIFGFKTIWYLVSIKNYLVLGKYQT